MEKNKYGVLGVLNNGFGKDLTEVAFQQRPKGLKSISDSDTQGKNKLGVRMHMLSGQEAARPHRAGAEGARSGEETVPGQMRLPGVRGCFSLQSQTISASIMPIPDIRSLLPVHVSA